MAKINNHHPDYQYEEWTLEVTGQMHRVLTVIQNTKASPEQYARLTNFLHSITQEWTRMRRDLDLGIQTVQRRKKKIDRARR